MNYNQLNRNSLINCIYSDRPTPSAQPTDSWKNISNEQHLNPSKSKVNVRQSLNKTAQSYVSNNPTIVNIRNSCLLNSSISHTPIKDAFQEDKYFKTAKQNQEPFTPLHKENFGRYSHLNQSTPQNHEDRRKSDSAHIRVASTNDFLYKLQNDTRPIELEKPQRLQKTQGSPDSLKEMIVMLTRRVATNEQDIAKLKTKGDKEKKLINLQNQLADYKSKMFELAKFNSKNYMQFESKLQHNQQSLTEIKEKIFHLHSAQDSYKKLNFLEIKLSELTQDSKTRQQKLLKQLSNQIFNIENCLKKIINEEITSLKNGLQYTKKELIQIVSRVKRIEADVDKHQQYKKSTKKSINSLTVENRQIMMVREGELIKDRTKHYMNFPQSSKREYLEQARRDILDTPRREEGKRQLIIKQKVYHIDNHGYLLDENKYYLLNSRNQQILLPDHLITCLRDNGMLSGSLRR